MPLSNFLRRQPAGRTLSENDRVAAQEHEMRQLFALLTEINDGVEPTEPEFHRALDHFRENGRGPIDVEAVRRYRDNEMAARALDNYEETWVDRRFTQMRRVIDFLLHGRPPPD